MHWILAKATGGVAVAPFLRGLALRAATAFHNFETVNSEMQEYGNVVFGC